MAARITAPSPRTHPIDEPRIGPAPGVPALRLIVLARRRSIMAASPPAASPHAAPSLRFDPFAFPPDTTFRFVLLIVAVIGASLFIFSALNTSLNFQQLVEQVEQCGPLAD